MTTGQGAGDRLPLDVTARVLRAKEHELEAMVRGEWDHHGGPRPIALVWADLALLAGMLADLCDRMSEMEGGK